MTNRRTHLTSLLHSTAILLAALCPAAALHAAGNEGVALDGKTGFSAPLPALDARAITVAARVRLADVTGSQVLLNTGEANSGFTLYLYSDNVRMLIRNKPNDYLYAVAPAPTAGKWVHYAGTYDGEAIRVYVDGKLAKSTPAPGRMHGLGKTLFIGALNESERPLHGSIDDVRIWRRVLSDQEIAAVAAGKGDASSEKLVAHWAASGRSGTTWKAEPAGAPIATRFTPAPPQVLINRRDTGYRGIWYMNQPSGDEYVYKYSGGMGTYPANHTPYAWYVPKVNKTFFTYGGSLPEDSTRLIHMVSYYDHATGMVPRPTILLDKKTDDAHDNPVINVDDAGTIWIFSSSHGRSRPSYISRSTKPYSVDAFELVWTGNYSYPQPWYLSGHGFLLMHTYYNPGRTICMMTSEDGVKWSERRLLSSIAQGHYQVSRPLGRGRVGTSFMYHPKGKGLNWRTNLYYMESDDFGATWRTAGGESLNIPLTDIVNPALVQEYESKGLLVYIQDLASDAEGRPVVLYTTSKGYESGPKNMPRTWTTAYWNGRSWELNGGDIISDNNYDTGSLYIEADRWRIIGPTQQGPQAYNPGGEIAMWESTDHGKSWKLARQMTSASEYNHTYVRRPVNAHPDFYGFWADGHGRKPSDSRLYFCNKAGDVFRLPVTMEGQTAKPERVNN